MKSFIVWLLVLFIIVAIIWLAWEFITADTYYDEDEEYQRFYDKYKSEVSEDDGNEGCD